MFNFILSAGKWILANKAKTAALALAAGSAYQTREAGKAQEEAYNQQAADAVLQGRSAAVAYRQQGADILNNLVQTQAIIRANAAASGIEVTTGNPANLVNYANAEAIKEYNIARDNSILAYGQAGGQARLFAEAGSIARSNANIQSILNIGQAGIKLTEQLAKPGSDYDPTNISPSQNNTTYDPYENPYGG